jgi:acetyltransferase-like isoleucine patch superfamily enzyme
VNLVKGAARFLRARQFERRYACRVYPGAQIQPGNRHIADSIVVGAHTHIRGQLFTFGHGGQISMGEYCYLGENSKIWSGAEIKIGDRVLIGHNSSIFDSDTHPLNPRERHAQYVEIITTGHPAHIDLRDEPVSIEDDVWIGCNVVVLKGVTIGKGAVVGAGSIVTKDVPSYVIVAGNPARIVRELSADER